MTRMPDAVEVDVGAGPGVEGASRRRALGGRDPAPTSPARVRRTRRCRRRSSGGASRPRIGCAFSRLLQNLKIAAVPHGFRSSFRDWAAEETNHPREVVEAALAHAVGNRTEAAYARSDLFERRRRLMDEWAAYLNAARAGR